jgi:hypothetical protein
MAGLSVGDAVDVTFSGVVEANVGQGYVGVKLDDGLIHWVKETHVEKVEPEYEVFGPGDVVRFKPTGTLRALGKDGYVHLGTGQWFGYGLGGGDHREHFNSLVHERVSVE